MFYRLLTEPESEDVIDALMTYHREIAADAPDLGEPEHRRRSRELLRDRVGGLLEEYRAGHRARFTEEAPLRLRLIGLPEPGADCDPDDDPVVRLAQRMYLGMTPAARRLLETDLDSDEAVALGQLLAREEGPTHAEDCDLDDDCSCEAPAPEEPPMRVVVIAAGPNLLAPVLERLANDSGAEAACRRCSAPLQKLGALCWASTSTGGLVCDGVRPHVPGCLSVSAEGTCCELTMEPGAHGPYATAEEANAVRHRGRNAAGLRVAWRPGNGQSEELDLDSGLSIEELFEEAGRLLRQRVEAQGSALIGFVSGWIAGSDPEEEPEPEPDPAPTRPSWAMHPGYEFRPGGLIGGRHDRGYPR